MPKGKKNKKELKGVLEAYAETGTEGYVWAFCEDGKKGYDGLHVLEAGDHLTIFSKGGLRIFSATIKPDYKIGLTTIPGTKYQQPMAFGAWIHWTQRYFLPDQWAKFFFHYPPFRAILRKK